VQIVPRDCANPSRGLNEAIVAPRPDRRGQADVIGALLSRWMRVCSVQAFSPETPPVTALVK